MPIICVVCTHLPVKVELQRQPTLKGRPFVAIGTAERGRKVIVDASPETKGIATGMPLEHALARSPGLTLVAADHKAYTATWRRVLDALEGRSPVVEDAGLGVAYVDLRGLDRLYGSEARAANAVLCAVPEALRPRLAVAQARFPAYVAALRTEPGRVTRIAENMATFLNTVPVTMLPVSWPLRERLLSFGLKTVGDVAALGPGPLQGEFRQEGTRLWKLCQGEDEIPLVPRRHAEVLDFSISFPAPTTTLPVVMIGLERLVRRAFGEQGLAGRAARVATLGGNVVDGPPFHRRVAFQEAVATHHRALEVLGPVLERTSLPGPLEGLSLELSGIAGAVGHQGSLLLDVRRREHLAEAVRTLEARLGRRPPLYYVREVEPWSRIPERRMVLMPFVP